MVIDVSDGKVGLKLVVSVFCIYLCIFFFIGLYLYKIEYVWFIRFGM